MSDLQTGFALFTTMHSWRTDSTLSAVHRRAQGCSTRHQTFYFAKTDCVMGESEFVWALLRQLSCARWLLMIEFLLRLFITPQPHA